MSSSPADLLEIESKKNDAPGKKESSRETPDWHKELAEKPASGAKQSSDKVSDFPKRTEDGKTDFETGNFHVSSKDGVYTVQEKIDGQIKGTLIYDTNAEKGQVYDAQGKLLYKVNGKKGYLEHLLANGTSIFQLSAENLDLNRLQNINEELGIAPLKPSEQRLFTNTSGDMAIFKKGASEKDDDTKVLIHRVESSDKSLHSVYFDVNGNKFELNEGKIYNVLGGDQPGLNGSRMAEFTKWNADGSYDFLDRSGKSIVKMYRDGRLGIGSTEVNLLSSEINTASDQGVVKTFLENNKVIVDRSDLAKFSVSTDGVMENLSLHKGVFVNYKPKVGLDGSVENGAHYIISHDRINITDYNQRRMVIHNNGAAETYNPQGWLLKSLAVRVPGGLAVFEDQEDENGEFGSEGKKHTGNSTITAGAIDAVTASLPAITLKDFGSQRGLLEEMTGVLVNAAQKFTAQGNLAMTVLCLQNLSMVSATADRLLSLEHNKVSTS